MKQRWTLNIEGFGKIERAEIEISPMMLFVGENNSGKSYVMSLLWGILTLGKGLFPRKEPETEAYRRCVEWFIWQVDEAYFEADEDEIQIDEEAQTLFLEWFNELLKQGKEKLVERVFNHPISIGEVYLSDFKSEIPISLQVRDYYSTDFSEHTLTIEVPKDDDNFYEIMQFICIELLIESVCQGYEPVYLPASRTGFMLTYKTLLANMIDPTGFDLFERDAQKYRSQFTLPITKFLRQLVSLSVTDGDEALVQISNYMERRILKGQVKKDDSPVPNYLFQPQGTQTDLPLHVTSSLVSELSPVILLLKSESLFTQLIIEEPEAHLHLELQKEMTNALIRLVNTGVVPVWLTTHSDTILQQVNNMIKLYNNSKREELAQKHGYEVSDMLDPSKVKAYQFSVQDDGTTRIEPLKLTPYGLAAPTFNVTIAKLVEEAYEFEENDADVD